MNLLRFISPPTFREVVFQDTLKHLFQCGICGASLLNQLPFGLVKPGRVTDVCCPGCSSVWAFTRIPNELATKPQLDNTEIDAAVHAILADVSTPDIPFARCTRCGRPLTDPKSIARGLGPDCAAKNGNGHEPVSTTSNAMKKLL